MIRVGVMGCGGMGKKRIEALKKIPGVEYIGVSDEARYLDYQSLDDLLLDDPDWILVCLPHDAAVGVTLQALDAGVKVFMEKPMGRNLAEAMMLEARGRGRLFVGMNYRFYPGVRALVADIQAGWFGDVLSVDMELGHGGKPGDEKTWKLDPKRNGGALLDPGIHLLDLLRHMGFKLGDAASSVPIATFWKTGIEEEVRVLGETSCAVVSLCSSIVRWRNTFRIQVNGTEGYGVVERRGGNYGPQSYRRGRRWGWQTSGSHWPEEWVIRKNDCSNVFVEELRDLFFPGVYTVGSLSPHVCTSVEAAETMRVYDRIAKLGQCETKSSSHNT